VSELEAFVRGQSPALPDRSIVLTFDDGMASVWTSAFPLLRKHGFRATVFLIPGKIRQGGEPRPTLEDVWAGRARAEDIGDADRGSEPLATWREIETMSAAGVIEFESHTLHHGLVFTGPRLTGFVTPEALRRYHPFEFSFAHLFEDSNVGGVTPPPLGTPIYASAPRCAAERRFLDDPRLREACIGFVESHGGEAFFLGDGWRSELPRFVDTWRAQHGIGEHYETPEERHRALLRELRISKEMIEDRLGRPVRQLCYPWGLGSELASRLSREVGYQTNLWAKVDGRLTNRPGDDPYRISRVSSDFLALLPGEPRTTLPRLILRKLRRRVRTGSAYLSH
jgi:peptidoglycan/xylan/chitin deacetylase (PgdA/CDA1 family)